jgi:hypothetical protein
MSPPLLSAKKAEIPIFHGSREKFPVWWLRFKVFAQTYKFKETLIETAVNEAIDQSESEEETDARKRNSDAVDIYSCFGEGSNKIRL